MTRDTRGPDLVRGADYAAQVQRLTPSGLVQRKPAGPDLGRLERIQSSFGGDAAVQREEAASGPAASQATEAPAPQAQTPADLAGEAAAPGTQTGPAQTSPGGPAAAPAATETAGTGAPTQEPDPEPPESLNQRSVKAYLSEMFGKHAGFSDFVQLTVSVKSKKKPDGSATPVASLPAFWTQIQTELQGIECDMRNFDTRGVIETQTTGRRPGTAYIHIRAGLTRPPVKAGDEGEIEDGLVKVDPSHCKSGGQRLSPETYEAYKALYAAIPPQFLEQDEDYGKITSGYRPASQQAKMYAKKLASVATKHPEWTPEQREKEARTWVAKPGTSAHNTGHAVDLWMGWANNSGGAKAMNKGQGKLYDKYGEFWEWLKAQAPGFGFLPYSAEPWHWEKWA